MSLRRVAIYCVLILTLMLPALAKPDLNRLFPELGGAERRLLSGYLDSLDFAECLGNRQLLLNKRRAWNREGYRYTPLLVQRLQGGSESATLIALLGGTQDDRAAVALKTMLPRTHGKTRWEIYGALAELGFYTDYYASGLLAQVQSRNIDAKEICAPLLARIHRPEAVWAQDQMQKQRLIDGAVAEMVFPLLEFRDFAFRHR